MAGRSGDLAAALRRAVPALTQTDNLLNLLGNDSNTLQQLTSNSDAVITALANNSTQVQRFITEANNAATDTATQQANLRLTLQRLPPFLEQLRPALSKLGAATDANLPVLGQPQRRRRDSSTVCSPTCPRSPARLGRRSNHWVRQRSPAPSPCAQPNRPSLTSTRSRRARLELGQNLAIVLHDLDDRNRAVEKDPRSPGGQGYTGLEALLQYVFNQPLAINTFGPFGHQLTVDAFVSAMCTPYATPGTIASNLKAFGSAYRSCYSWLGPSQPGVNTTDPSAPTAAVPDPGGAPPGQRGPATSATKLVAADTAASAAASTAKSPVTVPVSATPGLGLGKTLGSIFSALGSGAPAPGPGNATASSTPATPAAGAGSASSAGSTGASSGTSGTGTSSGSGGGSNQTQALLNYLLSP